MDLVGIELEPFCGRLSPQAKSGAERRTSNAKKQGVFLVDLTNNDT